MVKCISSLRFFPVFVLVCLLVLPQQAQAQCMVTNTSVFVGATYTYVKKTLNGTYICSLVTSNNASLCAPAVPLPRMTLTASASSVAIAPSCSFACTGGTACASITITGADGLPVELLEFKIVQEETVYDAGDELGR